MRSFGVVIAVVIAVVSFSPLSSFLSTRLQVFSSSCCLSRAAIYPLLMIFIALVFLSQAHGFMDATTSFMHSKADREGTNYGEVLKEARDAGHAEGELLLSGGICLDYPENTYGVVQDKLVLCSGQAEYLIGRILPLILYTPEK